MRRFFNNKLIIISLLILFFVAIRVIIILSSETLTRQGEEPYVGTIALGMLEGWAMPPWDFQAVRYNGGSILIAGLALPFFILFGFKIIASFSTAILVHSLGLIFIFLLVERYFNRRAAILTCIFYTFAPPLYMIRSLINNGSHAESATFCILIFYVFLKLVYHRASLVNYSLLGFLTGLSLWFDYLNIITVTAYTLVWFILDRLFFLRKKYSAYLISLFIGFMPWYLYNSRNNFDGLGFVSIHFSNHLGSIKLSEFISDCLHLIKSGYKIFIFNNYSLLFGDFFNRIYYAIFILSLAYILFLSIRCLSRNSFLSGKNTKGMKLDAGYVKYLLIALLPFSYLLVYLLSNLRYEQSGRGMTDYRYSVILFPCIFICIALLIDRMLCVKNYLIRCIGIMFLSAIIGAGIVGNGRLVYSLDFRNNYLNSPAIYYDLVGRVAAKRFGFDIAMSSTLINKIRDNNAIKYAYEGYGRELGARINETSDYERYIGLDRFVNMTVDMRKGFWKGIGRGIAGNFMRENHHLKYLDLERLILTCDKIEIKDTYRDFLYTGVIYELINWHDRPFNFKEMDMDNLTRVMPCEYRYLIYIYYGFQVGEISAGKVYYDSSFDLSCNLLPDDLKYYYIGMGLGINHFFSGDTLKSISFLNKYHSSVREHLLIGVALFSYYLYNSGEDLSVVGFPDKYKIYYRKAMDLFKNKPISE